MAARSLVDVGDSDPIALACYICGLFRYLKILVMHIVDSHGIAAKVHNELAVLQYAHHIAYLPCHNACQYAELYVVSCELDERVAQKGYSLGLCRQDLHEWFHDAVFDRGGLACSAIVDQMVLLKVFLEKGSKVLCLTLQKHKAAHGGLLYLGNAATLRLALVADGAVNKAFWLEIAFELGAFESLFEFLRREMLYKQVAPRGSLFFTYGYFFYFSGRFCISPNNVYALW